METILGKRRSVSWRDLGGKAEELKKVVVLRPDVHAELQKKARLMRLSMGEVVRRSLGMDVPLLKEQMGCEAQWKKMMIARSQKFAEDVAVLCGE
jgi:glutamate/tyrosine decarboxylase-like PLP-dependent enzyme